MQSQYEQETLSKTEDLIEALVMSGWSMMDDFVSERMVKALKGETRQMEQQHMFRATRIGRGKDKQKAPHVHGDRIAWLDHANDLPNQSRYLKILEELMERVNRLLYLGLFDMETHVTIHMPGSSHTRHLDNVQGDNRRLLTTVLYLNNDWEPTDGGELRLYFDETDNADFIDIPPRAGRLVAFLSNRFPYEVLPARSEQLSITSWFRQQDNK